MQTVKGSDLPQHLQREALACFVHRYTGDHVPDWATRNVPAKFGKRYPLQFASDREWLEHTTFQVTNRGTLALRKPCHSSPTWPNGVPS